jgi:hypothetical protein
MKGNPRLAIISFAGIVFGFAATFTYAQDFSI